MGDKVKLFTRLLVTISVVSLATNAFLAWQWQSERQLLQGIIAGTKTELELRADKNRELTQENRSFKTDIAIKEQELAKKTTELAAKQSELNDLSKQLNDKKAELDKKIKDLASAQKQIDSQKSQLAANASELSKLRDRPPLFSFQVKATGISEVESKKEAVKQVVTDAYDVIEEIYGKAYLLHSVTITFVDEFSNPKAAGEIVISNSKDGLAIDIRIKDFDKTSFNDINTIIHEVVHAFRGLATLEPTAFEEGSTVAATDVVMRKLAAAGKIPKFSSYYIQLSDAEFAQKQASLSIPRNNDTFYGSSQVVEFYQVMGKAWYQLYEQDAAFFKKFNDKIYERKARGEEVTEKMVLDTIHEVLPGVSLSGAAWNLK